MAFLNWTNIAGETTLNASTGAANSSVGSLNLVSGGGVILAAALKPKFENPQLLGIEDEIVQVTDIQGDVVFVNRGVGGTTAASHANSTPVHVLGSVQLYALIKRATVAAAPGS